MPLFRLFSLIAFLGLGSSLFAATVSIPGRLYQYTLDNGFTVFVQTTNSDTIHLDIIVRGGADALPQDRAGIFKLYERCVLGDANSKNVPQALAWPLSWISKTGWQGGVQVEDVRYGFDFANSSLNDAINFFAGALRPQNFDPAVFQREQARLAKELGAPLPSELLLRTATNSYIFGRYPYRRDPNGSPTSIMAISADELAKLRDTFFVGSASALMITGRVNPEQVAQLAQKAFASWPREGITKYTVQHEPRTGLSRPKWLVYADPAIPAGKLAVSVSYHGPDAYAGSKQYYAAIVTQALLANNSGKFKQKIMATLAKSFDKPENIEIIFLPQREGSLMLFNGLLNIVPDPNMRQQVEFFKEEIRGTELTSIVLDEDYYKKEDIELAKTAALKNWEKLESDPVALRTELLNDFSLDHLDFFVNYTSGISAINQEDINDVISGYVLHNLEAVFAQVNPNDFSKNRAVFDEEPGFTVLSPDNVRWWQLPKN